MPRGLDHIVHAVHDLDAATDVYRRAGFTVGARNRHPWGTHNHVVQFSGFFIEILTVGEPEKLAGEGLAHIFGVANQEAIARGDGLSMLILESKDSEDDVADFARRGIGASPSLPFSRDAVLPDGSRTTVGFSLAFARDPLSPQTGFATCMQHNPAAFWKPDYQRHANGTAGVLGAVLVTDVPESHRSFLESFAGVAVADTGVLARTPRGTIEIVDVASFRNRFGVHVGPNGKGGSLKGLRLAVPDLAVAEQIFRSGGVAVHRHADLLVIPPEVAFGATLIFEKDEDPGRRA